MKSWTNLSLKNSLKTKSTYIIGDLHCHYDDFITALFSSGLRGVRIIHVGDNEEGYLEQWDKDTPKRLDEAFAKLEIEFLTIRGNHSNPHVFDGTINHPNFRLLADYTKLKIDNETWLFVGGAISVDRINRIPGMTWWVEEEMYLDVARSQHADVLVTHSGPTLTIPCNTDLVDHYARLESKIGTKTLKRELQAEAKRHDQLCKLVKQKQWYHGHHHHSATHKIGECTIRQLGVAELVLHKPTF